MKDLENAVDSKKSHFDLSRIITAIRKIVYPIERGMKAAEEDLKLKYGGKYYIKKLRKAK